MSYLSLNELCNRISISYGTGRNWVRLGKLVPQYEENKKPFFTEEYADKLIEDIRTGRLPYLRNRRNKSYVSGNSLYKSYVDENSSNIPVVDKLLKDIAVEDIGFDENSMYLLLADCALKLYFEEIKSGLEFLIIQNIFEYAVVEKESNEELKKLCENLEIESIHTEKLLTLISLINELDINSLKAKAFYSNNKLLFENSYCFDRTEDLLGLLYMSLRNITGRKAFGAYYTPGVIVKQLVEKAFDLTDTDTFSNKVLDPCCGTGNFLISLPDFIGLENIYGCDIDRISVILTKINLFLRFKPENIDMLNSHICCMNFLEAEKNKNTAWIDNNQNIKFDYIIGNPPWGAIFSEEEKKKYKQKYVTAKGKNIESYDVFVEKSFGYIEKNGVISFVLPEAILNVRLHKAVREFIRDKASIEYLARLDNHFQDVQCPSIILKMRFTGAKLSTTGMLVDDGEREFTIGFNRNIDIENFDFYQTDAEYLLLNKLMSDYGNKKVFLKNSADFALGIVTGNNNKYISDEKRTGYLPVLRGRDISKYRIGKIEKYIYYKPDELQQIAKEELYRCEEKLVYRFINSQLVFAYDDSGLLLLNSCNMVIPRIKGLSVKYVLAIMNSRIAQYVFSKKFNSIKVLRNHLEEIPIPFVDEKKQSYVQLMVDKLINEKNEDNFQAIYDELDKYIAELYGLDNEEYELILKLN